MGTQLSKVYTLVSPGSRNLEGCKLLYNMASFLYLRLCLY